MNMPRYRSLLLAFTVVASAGCHGDVEKTPLIDRKVYLTDKFYDVHAVSPERVIIVGYAGKILTTEDGGRSWAVRPSGTDNAIYKVRMLDQENGWAVGQSGTVLRTSDGGKTWQKVEAGTEAYLFSMAAPTPQHLIAVGDKSTIVQSEDGGATWTAGKYAPPAPDAAVVGEDAAAEDMMLAAQEPSFYDVHFRDEKTGWIVGEFGKILKTTDGGKTWKEQQQSLLGEEITDELDLPTFYGVDFINDKEGVAVGLEGRIAHTVDGGETWTFDPIGGEEHEPLLTVQLFPDGSGWAAGIAGEVMKREGGAWEPADLGMRVHSWLRRVSFADPNNGWLVGGFGLILHTRDGGKTWIPVAA
jgi:photosystem II stability/assembly factor-like uncharacterized protein